MTDSSIQETSSDIPGLSHLRIGGLDEELGQEGVVPSGAFELAFHRAVGGFEPGEVECQASPRSEVLGAVVFSVPGVDLVHGDVEHEGPTEQVKGGLGGGLAGDLSARVSLPMAARPGQRCWMSQAMSLGTKAVRVSMPP